MGSFPPESDPKLIISFCILPDQFFFFVLHVFMVYKLLKREQFFSNIIDIIANIAIDQYISTLRKASSCRRCQHRDLQLVQVQRIRDCGICSLKWARTFALLPPRLRDFAEERAESS